MKRDYNFDKLRDLLSESLMKLNAIEALAKDHKDYRVEDGIMCACEMVAAFHEKNRVSDQQFLTELDSAWSKNDSHLLGEAHLLHRTSIDALTKFKETHDRRLLRTHLILEELAELHLAMAAHDEVAALDALCDLLYVLVGSAVTMDLPLAAGFVEVHRSNMTKQRQEKDADGQRVRDKGPDYVPANLERILKEYRANQNPRQ